jgi:hypothetical protein
VIFDDNYDVYKKVLEGIVNIEDISIILNKNENNFENT